MCLSTCFWLEFDNGSADEISFPYYVVCRRAGIKVFDRRTRRWNEDETVRSMDQASESRTIEEVGAERSCANFSAFTVFRRTTLSDERIRRLTISG